MKLIYESESICERFEEVEPGIFFSDYVGDIVNLMLNKPKVYRGLYDSRFDCYALADANLIVHDDLVELLWDNGYVRQFMSEEDQNKVHNFSRVINGTDAQKYRLSSYKDMEYFIFVPYDENDGEQSLDSYYDENLQITSGNIWVHDTICFSRGGKLRDMYDKLDTIDAIG